MSEDIEFELDDGTSEPVKPSEPIITETGIGRDLVKDLLKVDLKEVDKELDESITVQYMDTTSGSAMPVFNALAKRVLIRDNDGKEIIIDNHAEINKIRRKNRIAEMKKDAKVNIDVPTNEDDDYVEFE